MELSHLTVHQRMLGCPTSVLMSFSLIPGGYFKFTRQTGSNPREVDSSVDKSPTKHKLNVPCTSLLWHCYGECVSLFCGLT